MTDFDRIRRRFIPMTETMFYILFSLRQVRHGYKIMQHVKDLTNGRIVLGAGTVYQSLKKLEAEGLIFTVDETGRKKSYILSDSGLQILKAEAARIKEIFSNVKVLL